MIRNSSPSILMSAGIFAEQDAVAFFYGHGNVLAFVKLAGSNCNYNAFLGLFFCGVGDDDATTNGFRFLNPSDDNAVM